MANLSVMGALSKMARTAINRRGISIVKQGDAGEQRAFFKKTRPMTTENPLIRVGQGGDGGYLLPDDLAGIAACFSPGVNDVAHFEEEMVSRNVPCFQADASVADTPLKHPLVHFQRKFLGIAEGDDVISFDKWVSENAPATGDLILQMDIEGAEWLVLAVASDEILSRFRIMIIEFHGMEKVFDPYGNVILSTVFDKLLKIFDIVHAHPNNCAREETSKEFTVPTVIEYTLHRRDRSTKRTATEHFPHPLDEDNSTSWPSMILSPSIYGSRLG